MELIECIPNLSEGRNHQALDLLWQHLQQVSGLYALDQHRDPDHHRTVLTLAGDAQAIENAAHLLFEWSLTHIDVSRHEGVHPRLGAVDVFPLVPLRGISVEEAVRFSHQLVQSIEARWNVPCLRYEKSAPEGREHRLPLLRKAWRTAPPSHKHPQLGGCVLGVRDPLVAWNVWLHSTNVSIARNIAQKLREVNGGFKGLRTLGLTLPVLQKTQVSMNLVEHKASDLRTIFQQIEAEAEAHGVRVSHTEFVGLVPESLFEHFPPTDIRSTHSTPEALAAAHGLNTVLSRITGKEITDLFV